MRNTPRSPLGLTAVDEKGEIAGLVEGTCPFDGSDPEFAIVKLGRGRFGQRRLVPLAGTKRYDETLQFPCTFGDMEAAPNADSSRYAMEQAEQARAYWMTAVDH